MRFLFATALALTSLSASADTFTVLAGYVCDPDRDRLQLTYDGAYNEAGEALAASKTETQWDPWTLIVMKDDDHIGTLKIARGQCQLSDGLYTIEIFPEPGNFNIQGRCGAWMTAGAKVEKAGTVLYSIARFENDCHDTASPIVTRVTIKPGQSKPAAATVEWDDFYK